MCPVRPMASRNGCDVYKHSHKILLDEEINVILKNSKSHWALKQMHKKTKKWHRLDFDGQVSTITKVKWAMGMWPSWKGRISI